MESAYKLDLCTPKQLNELYEKRKMEILKKQEETKQALDKEKFIVIF